MIKEILKRMITYSRLRMFKKNAAVGEKLQTDVHSLCVNRTGRKESIRIGDNCFIRGKLITEGEGEIQIGNNCYIGGGSFLGAKMSITLGNYVIISTDVHIMDNNNHPVSPRSREEMCKSGDYFGPLWSWDRAAHASVVIGSNVWIGERCAILKGVRIGEGSVVGCNSVVTKDVPPYSVVAGNPAKVVKRLEREQCE